MTPIALSLLLSCSNADTLEVGHIVPEFSLEDVNSTSLTYGSLISPRDSLGNVSGWYFGHAT